MRYKTIPVGVDKNHPGGRNFEIEYYYLVENKQDKEKCPLDLLEIYKSKRPAGAPDRLYLGIGACAEKSREPWYKKQPMGVNTIAKIVPAVAASIGLLASKTSKTRYSNHSLRATLPTILYQNSFDEQLISVITKHKSLHGVRSYKRTSIGMLAAAMDAVIPTEDHIEDESISKEAKGCNGERTICRKEKRNSDEEEEQEQEPVTKRGRKSNSFLIIVFFKL